VVPCPLNHNCEGPNNQSLAASLNNVSFANPTVDVLDAYYRSIPGVFEPDFPDRAPVLFNFTDRPSPTRRRRSGSRRRAPR
jgi:laccase